MPLLDDRRDARLIVIRPDRIGDVVLSTPVLRSLRAARPGWHIAVLVRPIIAGLLEGHPDIDEIVTLATDDKPSCGNTRMLAKTLRARRYDTALHLYSDFWVSLAAWRAGIPLRIGPASKLARIFYNRAITQRRSKGTRHETDYNLALLAPFGIQPIRTSYVETADVDIGESATLLDPARKNVGVFPGMGGSARNWRPEKYGQLIDAIAQNGVNLILMGGPGEEHILDRVTALATHAPRRYVGKSLKELAAFTKQLDCFVAPSTGPLHIATAVGTPAVGIYCPIRVCLPTRWGPIGERDASFVPDVPVCETCTAERCEHHDCMDRLPVERVADAVRERL